MFHTLIALWVGHVVIYWNLCFFFFSLLLSQITLAFVTRWIIVFTTFTEGTIKRFCVDYMYCIYVQYTSVTQIKCFLINKKHAKCVIS